MALLLAHAGQLDVHMLTDDPRVALLNHRGAKSEAVMTYMREHKKADLTTLAQAVGLPNKSLHNVVYNLVKTKRLKRIAPGVFALTESRT